MGDNDNFNLPLLEFPEVRDQMQGIIKVVGVGGGGCNAVNNMYKEGVDGVTYAASRCRARQCL